MNQQNRDTFSSKFGVLMAVIASAVGLGSIWRFPYLLGENGGGAFLIIYIAFMILIGTPVMLSEFIIGRKGQGNVLRSFKNLSPKSHWYLVGLMGILTAFVILSFYSTVAGWAFQYMIFSAKNIITQPVSINHAQVFSDFTSTIVLPLTWMFVFVGLTALVVAFGVQKGIEKYSKILMPIMFLALILLAIKGLTLPGSMEGLKFLFYPDFSKINTHAILSALGQAAFSLSVGNGIMITYGSYIKKNENLPSTAFSVTIIDIVSATICAIAIFPALFALGMRPEQGPGLVYVVYPAIFEQMHGGHFFAMSFFFMLIIAALTSAIPMLEVAVATLKEELKMSRRKATIISATFPAIIGIFTTLSFGPLRNVKIIGLNIFDASDFLASNILLPLGILGIVLFLGWFYSREHIKEEITNQGKLSAKFFPVFLFLIRYIIPIAVLIVFLKGLGMEGFGLMEHWLGE
ncbi:MAG: sodium-dependent transporter [Candidatus Cloacimonetes bacterium]|nr:sodium-dependent transporter [Candidatus Cloacimonadota bacterium]